MTRRLPPIEMARQRMLATPVFAEPAKIAADIFKGAPDWWAAAALAALYRFRPDLGVAVDDAAHERHMMLWPRQPDYFLRICRLLRHYGVGSQWGFD